MRTRSIRFAPLAALVVVGAIASFTAGASAQIRPMAFGKSCSPDGGAHVATVELHTYPGGIYGYKIFYHRNSGWTIGNSNNEIWYRSGGFPWWASPDNGAAETWVFRDGFQDFAFTGDPGHDRLTVDARFDRPNWPDPGCLIDWQF